MNLKEINDRLRTILDKDDIDKDHPITRNPSSKHGSATQVLLEHLSLLVTDLRFDAECSRRELIEVRNLLEYGEQDNEPPF